METGISTATLERLLGQEGLSDWHVITQQMVNEYVDLCGDGKDEWLHLDPVRAAKEQPYGGTIVQGSFQVSHLVKLSGEALRSLEGIDMNYALNYGFDRLRFVNPLPVGAKFRARMRVLTLTPKDRGGYLLKQEVTLEKENGEPTLVAEWLFYLAPQALAGAKEAGHAAS